MNKITILLVLIASNFLTKVQAQSVATYDIVFTSTWNAGQHSSEPTGAHWSKLVGTNHNSNVSFFEVGQMASSGIEMIAESGANNQFRFNDVQDAIDALNAEQYIDGPSLPGSAAGTITITGLEVGEDYPLLTLLSMVAPSPDWFIGVNGLDLLDSPGNWKSSINIPMMYVYDAGTDSGVDYTSPNADSNLPISIFDSANPIEPFDGNAIGFLNITLTNVLSVDELNPLESINIFPNPSKGNLTISNTTILESVEIYNILGSIVAQFHVENDTKLQLDLNHLNKGLYLVKLKGLNGKTNTKKLILE